jgi:hypothetical protein
MKKIIAVVVVVLAGVCFAQSPRQVEVVAEVALTNQTGETTGTLFTPAQTGVFRVTFMVQCTRGNPLNADGLNPELVWTDDNGGERFVPGTVGDSAAEPPTSFTFVIKDMGGAPIEWGVSPVKPGDDSIYEVYIALERIGPKVQ